MNEMVLCIFIKINLYQSKFVKTTIYYNGMDI